MIAALASLPAAASPSPSDAACMLAIRSRGRTDPRCWRVGPLRIGMTRTEVEATLGPPDAADTVVEAQEGGDSRPHAVYLFPRDLARRLARDPQPSLRFDALELTYRDGRLVRIGDGVPVRSSGPACARAETGPEPPATPDADFVPYQRFLGMKIGDRLEDVRRKLGPWASISRGGDFVFMAHIPVTLGVDEDAPTLRKRVNDFAVGADDTAVTEGGWIDLTVDRDPATCRVRGFSFVAPRAAD